MRGMLPALIVASALACTLTAAPRPNTVTSPPATPTATAPPTATLCADPPPALVTDFAVYSTPDSPEPDARVPFRDPVFGTCVVRVTDRAADLASGNSGGLKNEYSRVQAFNADDSLILVRGTAGAWYLYDAATLQPIGSLSIEIDPRWDTSDPAVLYFSRETRLIALDVRSGAERTVHDFAADLPGRALSMVWTRYEGSPSFDGRIWGLMAEDADWQAVAFLVYDLQADQVIASRVLPVPSEIDSVTISPLGNYFLAYYDTYCENGRLGSDQAPCGLMAYDRDLRNGRGLLRIIGHSDTALDAGGREVLIYQDIDTDHIAMLDLASGAVTDLFPLDFSHSPLGLHFSGRAAAAPGWALVSTYSGADATWMDDSVFAVELKAGARVVRLAHTHSRVDPSQEHDYWAEPQASAGRDFTQVVFTSNWGRSGTDEVDLYMVVLPPGWLEQLP